MESVLETLRQLNISSTKSSSGKLPPKRSPGVADPKLLIYHPKLFGNSDKHAGYPEFRPLGNTATWSASDASDGVLPTSSTKQMASAKMCDAQSGEPENVSKRTQPFGGRRRFRPYPKPSTVRYPNQKQLSPTDETVSARRYLHQLYNAKVDLSSWMDDGGRFFRLPLTAMHKTDTRVRSCADEARHEPTVNELCGYLDELLALPRDQMSVMAESMYV